MATRTTKKKISKDIVRVWFDTVLNPLYDGLSNVKELLEDNDLTWNWDYRDFVDIKPFDEYFHYKYKVNYEQLVMTEFKELKDFEIDYNKTRTELNNSCCRLFDLLIQSYDLKKLILDKLTEYENKKLISENDADYLRNSHSINWISTYIINNRNELPFNHIFKQIWNNEHHDFFKILENDNIKPTKEELIKNCYLLKCITSDFIGMIKVKRFELSVDYGVPIVI